VSKAIAFWDTSALAPLCVEEATSRQAQSLLKRYLPVVWWATVIEMHSAIYRLYRLKQIDDHGKQAAFSRLALLQRGWKEILPGDSLRQLATSLLNSYSLSAADSLQLAAALIWCQERPSNKHIICADRRLAAAAQSAGFSVLELSASFP